MNDLLAIVPLIKRWRAKADDCMRAAKGYNCNSNAALRTGLIKQAAQARMCADELERAYAETTGSQAKDTDDRADQGQTTDAVGCVGEEQLGWEAPYRASPAEAERSDQGT